MARITPVHLSAKRHATVALGSLVSFALAATYAYDHVLFDWENAVFRAIYNLPTFAVPAFVVITTFGGGWALALATLIAWAKRFYGLAIKLLFNGVVATLLVEYCKHMIGRPRPAGLVDDITQRQPFTYGNGFPSGHTTLTMVLALTMWPYVPSRYRWLLILWIVLVGFSRLYLGLHAPLDIIGGLALGIMIASLQHTWSASGRVHKRLKIRTKRLKLKKEV